MKTSLNHYIFRYVKPTQMLNSKICSPFLEPENMKAIATSILIIIYSANPPRILWIY